MQSQRSDIIKRLLLLGAFLQRHAGRELADLGINQQQFVVLKEIEQREPVNQKDLCSALLFQKSNVSKIVSKIELMGLVKRQVDAADNRMNLFSLSKKGRDAVREGMKRLDRWNTAWLESLPAADTASIAAALEKLTSLTLEKR